MPIVGNKFVDNALNCKLVLEISIVYVGFCNENQLFIRLPHITRYYWGQITNNQVLYTAKIGTIWCASTYIKMYIRYINTQSIKRILYLKKIVYTSQ